MSEYKEFSINKEMYELVGESNVRSMIFNRFEDMLNEMVLDMKKNNKKKDNKNLTNH